MGLLSFFKRHDESTGDTPAPDAVAHARTRARRRLIGATVLLGIGVIGFPLLFETQPRPIPVDIPIEIPRRESAPPLALPPAQPASAAAVMPATKPVQPVPVPVPVITEREADQGREVVPAAPRVAAAPSAAKPSVPVQLPAPAPASAPKPAVVVAATTPSPVTDGLRAQALLDGKPAAKASDNGGNRVVVQVGAYTDADKLREARQRVEKLGMKTYTQVIDAEGGKRTRVRVGPFATREEADKAAARIKAIGLPVAILSL